MKLVMLLLFSSVFQAAYSETVTSGTRGGGDLCENRIKIIRDDLKNWISKDGPSSLKLPDGILVGTYTNDMMNVLSTATVECIAKGDHGYPVEVNGVSKVCVFDSGKNNIRCDINKFTNTNESDQYILIHHEYAGLANIEIPNASDSNYSVSNQLSGYLVDHIIKKLAVKPPLQTPVLMNTSDTTDFRKLKHNESNNLLKAFSVAAIQADRPFKNCKTMWEYNWDEISIYINDQAVSTIIIILRGDDYQKITLDKSLKNIIRIEEGKWVNFTINVGTILKPKYIYEARVTSSNICKS